MGPFRLKACSSAEAQVKELFLDDTQDCGIDLARVRQFINIIQQRLRRRKNNRSSRWRNLPEEERKEKVNQISLEDTSDIERLEMLNKIDEQQSLQQVDFTRLTGLPQIFSAYQKKLTHTRKAHRKLFIERSELEQLVEAMRRTNKRRQEFNQSLISTPLTCLGQNICIRHRIIKDVYDFLYEGPLHLPQYANFLRVHFAPTIRTSSTCFPPLPGIVIDRDTMLLMAKNTKTESQSFAGISEMEFLPYNSDVRFHENRTVTLEKQTLESNFPHLRRNKELMDKLIGKKLHLKNIITVQFNDQNNFAGFHSESNAYDGFMSILKDPKDVALLFSSDDV